VQANLIEDLEDEHERRTVGEQAEKAMYAEERMRCEE